MVKKIPQKRKVSRVGFLSVLPVPKHEATGTTMGSSATWTVVMEPQENAAHSRLLMTHGRKSPRKVKVSRRFVKELNTLLPLPHVLSGTFVGTLVRGKRRWELIMWGAEDRRVSVRSIS